MAKIANKVIWWQSVPDAVAYNIRIIPDGVPFDYGKSPQITVDHMDVAEHEADLAGLDMPEGVYDVYISAEDAGGNESDPLELADAVLDFVPPAAPSAGGFR